VRPSEVLELLGGEGARLHGVGRRAR
jgi:hypothetical protein